ncbi:UDP-2,3-diacylglucosamine diphosphatase [Neisseria animalis]|uniref:UDP-2,3-diacylglucosamine hydrolase n=1 Tax=Neisseria animalis TaxID=492 RepID=A0A5P3MRG3_NEIAN|nr:UDP-2,3-diacylglucosamine diphosphatase [Neisseria animalis]QEY24197.1 UDP-2,3-diacylglucosamine diphosphatase [Neisseria animalis]ROW32193.1 UDP-2,3-diacylglucosamine diphosphatase [Neisseria animalis]VEE06496.1 UDP-2,3-diacylglucosamine hydrolase [Neisseria animalis]
MKPIYFIADLHLSEARSDLTDLFVRFMAGRARTAQAVYILGDLFDFWIGDDEQSAVIDAVKQAVCKLKEQNVPCYFIHGNRDFLIGERFAVEAGMTLLPEYQLVEAFGNKILLCHGDTLCTDDVRYQAFRRKVQQKWLQKLFLLLPLSWRLAVAHRIRAVSQKEQRQKMAEIMDVNLQFTEDTVRRYGVKLLIHGHTHRQNIHHEAGWQRIVLGDWKKDQPSILRYDGKQFEFVGLDG